MGSDSDFETMEPAVKMLEEFGIEYECLVMSAHRTPDRVREFAQHAEDCGIRVIIAGAGGAAHLPGVIAAHTTLPVLGVPVSTAILGSMDSVLSILSMPSGVPVATFSVGKSGAKNAALFAISILAIEDSVLDGMYKAWRAEQAANIPLVPRGLGKRNSEDGDL